MRSVDTWLENAKPAYEGEAMDALLDRIGRAKGDYDAKVLAYLIYQELKAIRAALEKPSDAPKGPAKR